MDQAPTLSTSRAGRSPIRDDEVTRGQQQLNSEADTTIEDESPAATVLVPASDPIQEYPSSELKDSVIESDEIEASSFLINSDDTTELLFVSRLEQPEAPSEPVRLPLVRMCEGDFADVLHRLINHQDRHSVDVARSRTSSPRPIAIPLEPIASNEEASTFPLLHTSERALSTARSFPDTREFTLTSSIFFGIRCDMTAHRMSYLERDVPLPHRPRLTSIFQSISGPLSQVGRILSKWPSGGSETLVATSSTPIDVIDDSYYHWSTRFKYIATLDDVLNNTYDSIRVEPAPESEQRTCLYQQAELEIDHPLYVIYIIHENGDMLRGRAPVGPTPLQASLGRPAAQPSAALEFLRLTYPQHTAALATLGGRGYARGYVTCLKYRIFEDVRKSLPSGCGVQEEDLYAWVDEKQSTWRNVKCRAKAADAAIECLLARKSEGSLDVLPGQDYLLLEVLLRGSLTPLPIDEDEREALGRSNDSQLRAQKTALRLSGLGLGKITKRVNQWMY